ncbi:MAG: ribonuclease T2 [Terracidiphilus sp.]|nr:ribonuclease T2 [Terracidiphilus sp.]
MNSPIVGRIRASRACFLQLGLLLVLSMSGCKNPAPSATSANTYAANGPAATSEPYSDSRHERQRSKRGRAETQATPGEFDFYLLNLSWSPEFCATHSSSTECGRGLGFVVHGMWPQDITGDYPENCSDAPGPANPQAYTDIIPTASLVNHEWQVHGTCSGLQPDAYFAAIRTAYSKLKIPAGIGAGDDSSGVPPQQLLERFEKVNPGFPAGSIALSCGNNRLTAVEVCLTKDLHPESCQGVRSCRANVVKVTPP